VHVIGRGTALNARRGARTRGMLHFTSFYKSAMATLFHVNSSLAAGQYLAATTTRQP
jgi:hypothetical protein